MKIFTIPQIILFVFVITTVLSCQDKWDEHVDGLGSTAGKNLYEVINGDAKYSKFAELLDKSGYASALQSSKSFTLILPDNAAIDAVSGTVNFNDTTALRAFVGYHVINSVYTVNMASDTIRARNLRGKYVDLVNGNFNNIVPEISNQVASNGIYHVVGQALTPYRNLYNFLLNFEGASSQKAALLSFDTAKVVGDTTLIFRGNSFVNDVYRPMTNERQKYTYFILENGAFDAEYTKLSPFYTTTYTAAGPRPDSTTEFFTRLNLLKDFIVGGDFAESNMPDTLTSLSGFKFQLDKSKIISSNIVSNGRVYYVSSLPYKLSDQIRTFKVLGTSPRGFSQNDKSGNIYYRTKIDNNGKPYNDIQIHAHDVADFYASYLHNGTYKATYKVWGRAISGLRGDPQTTAFTQYVNFYNPSTGLFTKPVKNQTGTTVNRFTFTVEPLFHDEVYLGEYTQDEFGKLDLRLYGGNVRTTGQNTIILEYLRFEPVLPN